jgi:hypothetical protein
LRQTQLRSCLVSIHSHNLYNFGYLKSIKKAETGKAKKCNCFSGIMLILILPSPVFWFLVKIVAGKMKR